MRIDVESEDLIAMISAVAVDTKDEARIRFPGARADAVIIGVGMLYDALRIVLEEAEEFDLSPGASGFRIMEDAVGLFCRQHCTRSKAQEPGTHDDCQACPIMPLTVGAVEGAVDRAMDTVDDGAELEPTQDQADPPGHTQPSEQPGAFDPGTVAAARRALDQRIKGGR